MKHQRVITFLKKKEIKFVNDFKVYLCGLTFIKKEKNLERTWESFSHD